MSSLGGAWMGLINQLNRIGSSPAPKKIELSQNLIRVSEGPGQINRGCRAMGLKYLAEAVVDKDRKELAA